jgi:ABC-type glycerol-3-phosphate transport system substrate-binding protein
MAKAKLIVFALLCAAIVLQACSSNSGSPADDTQGLQNTAPAAEEEAEPIIPAQDMNGKEITIITAGWWDSTSLEVHDICPDEYYGEPLNDSAYDRKIKIEEKYNCKIAQVHGSYEPGDDVKKVQLSVKAGDHAYDVAMMRGINFTGLLAGNYLLEMGELLNIDFENPWWRKNCSEALRIGGTRYGVSGNISSVEINMASLVCFNKNVIKDHGFESPYELVKSGNWTIDKMMEMAKQAARDIDGDGRMTDADMWGINYDRDRVWNLLNSSGVKMMEIDSQGFPRITIDEGDNLSKIQNIFIKLFDESFASNARRISGTFVLERALFRLDWALGVIDLREHDFDFGVVPLPKYNAEQKDYMPNVYGLGVPIVCVPSTNTDMENTGAFMEAFSYEGYKSVIPIFYENVLKTKSARDSESEDMIDYIFGNLHFDTGTLLNFDNFTQRICEMAETLDTNIASFVEKNKARTEKEIQKIMDAIEESR